MDETCSDRHAVLPSLATKETKHSETEWKGVDDDDVGARRAT